MTRYEELLYKANLCRKAAFRVEDENTKEMWIGKANELEAEAANMPLVKASQEVQ